MLKVLPLPQVPLHLRVAFGSFGSFLWMVALSTASSKVAPGEVAPGEQSIE